MLGIFRATVQLGSTASGQFMTPRITMKRMQEVLILIVDKGGASLIYNYYADLLYLPVMLHLDCSVANLNLARKPFAFPPPLLGFSATNW